MWRENISSDLQIGHGDAVQHVVAGLLDGTEQVVERSDVDAGLLVCPQHGVRLPTTWKQKRKLKKINIYGLLCLRKYMYALSCSLLLWNF